MLATNQLRATTGKGNLITLWTLSSLVALAFIAAGGAKLAGAASMVAVFDKVGLGQWFRYVTGALEVAAGIGFPVPRSAFYPAVSPATAKAPAAFGALNYASGFS